MAVTHGLYFALAYACMLALFGYTLMFFMPIAARIVVAALKSVFTSHHAHDDLQGRPLVRRMWWERDHSQ